MNLLNGKVKLFRAARIDVYLHASFIIVAAFRIAKGWGANELGWTSLMLGVLWVSILLHEFGHCFGARRMGGDATQILMWPLGGLASCHAPRRAFPQFFTTAAGPAVNVVLAIVGWVAAWLLESSATASEARFWTWAGLRALYGTNLFLAVFNIIPAFPMDGGRIFQTILWPWLGFKKSLRIAIYLAFACGAAMIVVGILNVSWFEQLPELPFIGVFVIFMSFRELQLLRWGELEEEREPWQQPELDLEPDAGPGPIQRFFDRRAEARRRREEEEERARSDRLDDVLRRVNEVGLGGLTPGERAFLEQESARKRDRK